MAGTLFFRAESEVRKLYSVSNSDYASSSLRGYTACSDFLAFFKFSGSSSSADNYVPALRTKGAKAYAGKDTDNRDIYYDTSSPTVAFCKNGIIHYCAKGRTVVTNKVNSVTRWAVSSPTASVDRTTTSGNKTYTYYAQSVTFTATLSCTGTPLADMTIASNSGVWSGTLTGNPDSAVSNGGALSRTVKFTQGTYGTGSASANTVIRVRDRTGNTTVNANVGQYTYTGSLTRGTVSTEE